MDMYFGIEECQQTGGVVYLDVVCLKFLYDICFVGLRPLFIQTCSRRVLPEANVT